VLAPRGGRVRSVRQLGIPAPGSILLCAEGRTRRLLPWAGSRRRVADPLLLRTTSRAHSSAAGRHLNCRQRGIRWFAWRRDRVPTGRARRGRADLPDPRAEGSVSSHRRGASCSCLAKSETPIDARVPAPSSTFRRSPLCSWRRSHAWGARRCHSRGCCLVLGCRCSLDQRRQCK
jgi:hypothetical protein